MARHAQCECGSFKIVVDGEPAFWGLCSCLSCQRRSGSIVGAAAVFPKDSVRVVSGEYKMFVRVGDAGGKLHQHFCPECGTTLFWDADYAPDFRIVAIGCFADPTFPPPQVAQYERSRHPWFILPKGLPTFQADASRDEIVAVLTKR
jgi:hypothetical protein